MKGSVKHTTVGLKRRTLRRLPRSLVAYARLVESKKLPPMASYSWLNNSVSNSFSLSKKERSNPGLSSQEGQFSAYSPLYHSLSGRACRTRHVDPVDSIRQ